MGPEKEIAVWWLNRNGFFTITSIKVARNKEIEILAFKPYSDEILHVELSCSVSTGILGLQKSMDDSVNEFINKKFNDSAVERAVRRKIKEFFGNKLGSKDGASTEYEKAVVLGVSSVVAAERKDCLVNAFQKKGIKVMRFEELLLDVMNNLDGQNYKSDVIRTLQLSKFLLISSPRHAAGMLTYSGAQEALNSASKEEFLRSLLREGSGSFVRMLQKESNEGLLLSIVRNSSLKKTSRFIKMLDEDFTTRSRKKIHRELAKREKPVPLKKIPPRKEKSLLSFFSLRKKSAAGQKAGKRQE